MGKAFAISCAVFSALGAFLLGYDSGIISSSIAHPHFIEYIGNPSDAVTGGTVSTFQVIINYYGPRIYKFLDISTRMSLMITGINRATGIINTTLLFGVVDRIGRKWPLIAGGFGMAACMLVNAVPNQEFPASATNPNGNALRAEVAMNCVFQLTFTPLGCISWIYPAEIFPTEIRAFGASISALTNWGINLIFAQASPIALGRIGFNDFYCFFVFNLVSAFCYIVLYTETKALTLEQMDVIFGDAKVVHALQDPETVLAEKEAAVNREHAEYVIKV